MGSLPINERSFIGDKQESRLDMWLTRIGRRRLPLLCGLTDSDSCRPASVVLSAGSFSAETFPAQVGLGANRTLDRPRRFQR